MTNSSCGLVHVNLNKHQFYCPSTEILNDYLTIRFSPAYKYDLADFTCDKAKLNHCSYDLVKSLNSIEVILHVQTINENEVQACMTSRQVPCVYLGIDCSFL